MANIDAVIALDGSYLAAVTFAVGFYGARLYDISDQATKIRAELEEVPDTVGTDSAGAAKVEYVKKIARYEQGQKRNAFYVILGALAFAATLVIPVWLWIAVRGWQLDLNPLGAHLATTAVTILTLLILGVEIAGVLLVQKLNDDVARGIRRLADLATTGQAVST